jgi:outer membrane murein-binding lipoprotein Lpp
MGKMNGAPLTVALVVITCLVSVVIWLSGMTCGVATLSTAIREATAAPTAALQLSMDQTAKDFRTHERIPGHPQVIERVDALGEDVQDIRAGIARLNDKLDGMTGGYQRR